MENGGEYDSFLTQKKAKSNLDFIRTYGVERFIEQQRKPIELLEKMLKNFNDGRSKSFYCIATTLLPITDLETSLEKTKQVLNEGKINLDDTKIKSRILKEFLRDSATRNEVELRLRKKESLTK
ncbi:MAG: hypothetical protein IBV52_03000 [Candidatus Bathyarchaeota archaeon]